MLCLTLVKNIVKIAFINMIVLPLELVFLDRVKLAVLRVTFTGDNDVDDKGSLHVVWRREY